MALVNASLHFACNTCNAVSMSAASSVVRLSSVASSDSVDAPSHAEPALKMALEIARVI